MTPVHLMWTEQNLLSFNEQLCYMKHISTLITLVYWFSQSSSKQHFIPRLHRWVPSHTSLICPTNLELFLHRQSYKRRTYAHKKLIRNSSRRLKDIGLCFPTVEKSKPFSSGEDKPLNSGEWKYSTSFFYKESSSHRCVLWRHSPWDIHAGCTSQNNQPQLISLPVKVSLGINNKLLVLDWIIWFWHTQEKSKQETLNWENSSENNKPPTLLMPC